MKNLFLSICSLIITTTFAQNKAKDLFTAKEIVWYGLNFSEAKMVGGFDRGVGIDPATATEIKTKWIPGWNNIFIKEQKNFKLNEAFRKQDVFYNIEPSESQNADIDQDELMSINSYSFKDPGSTIKKLVSNYKGGEKTEGVGVTFIVESFNKGKEIAAIYVVVFDIKTKNILITEKVMGAPLGIGLRNYWAGALKDVIRQIDSVYYKKWKSAYKE